MNSAQRQLIKYGLYALAVVLVLISWKFLEPDSFWLEYSYRIVFDLEDGREWGLESRFQNLGTSLLTGLLLPIALVGLAYFIELGSRD